MSDIERDDRVRDVPDVCDAAACDESLRERHSVAHAPSGLVCCSWSCLHSELGGDDS